LGDRLSSSGWAGSLASRGPQYGVFAATMPDGTEVVVKVYPPELADKFNEELVGARAASQTSVGARFYGLVDVGPDRLAFAMERVAGGFADAPHGATPEQESEASHYASRVSDRTLADIDAYSQELLDLGYYASGEVQGSIDNSGRWRPIDLQGIDRLSSDPVEAQEQRDDRASNIGMERRHLERLRDRHRGHNP